MARWQGGKVARWQGGKVAHESRVGAPGTEQAASPPGGPKAHLLGVDLGAQRDDHLARLLPAFIENDLLIGRAQKIKAAQHNIMAGPGVSVPGRGCTPCFQAEQRTFSSRAIVSSVTEPFSLITRHCTAASPALKPFTHTCIYVHTMDVNAQRVRQMSVPNGRTRSARAYGTGSRPRLRTRA